MIRYAKWFSFPSRKSRKSGLWRYATGEWLTVNSQYISRTDLLPESNVGNGDCGRRSLYALGLSVKRKNGRFVPPFYRLSRDKRMGALQQCHDYVTDLLLSFFWTIIPFTLFIRQTHILLLMSDCYRLSRPMHPIYNVEYLSLNQLVI